MNEGLSREQRRDLHWSEWMGDNLSERYIGRAERRCPTLRLRSRRVLRWTSLINGHVHAIVHVYRKCWGWKW